jgi:hypothetical protein
VINLLYHRLSACQQKEIRRKNILFGTRFAGLPFWQPGGAACHFGSSPTVVGVMYRCSRLPPKGGEVLTTGFDGFVLRPQSLDTLPTTRLTNLDDHGILTSQHAGINLVGLDLVHILQSLAVELENLLRTDYTAIDRRLVAWDSDTHETHPGLTLCIFDNLELSSHFIFPLC